MAGIWRIPVIIAAPVNSLKLILQICIAGVPDRLYAGSQNRIVFGIGKRRPRAFRLKRPDHVVGHRRVMLLKKDMTQCASRRFISIQQQPPFCLAGPPVKDAGSMSALNMPVAPAKAVLGALSPREN